MMDDAYTGEDTFTIMAGGYGVLSIPMSLTDQCESNRNLIAASPKLAEALRAQDDFSDMQKVLKSTGVLPEADDPRYTPVIGEWDGKAGGGLRYNQFATKRRELRKAALALAEGGAG